MAPHGFVHGHNSAPRISLCPEVPDRLKIVRVERIQNLQNWAEFRSRQQEVLEEIKKLKDAGEKGVCKNGHELEPLGTTQDNGWGCDGRADGGCLSGITDFHQTKGMNRFRCQKCDFDYCDKCYILRTGAKLCMKGHPLVPLGTTKDNGWGCDNHSTKEGCLRANKTKGIDRYRCEQCDYDLCDKCYQTHIGHVLNNIKTDQMDLHSEESDKDSNTVWLFHGTSTEAATLITRGDFLVDKAGSNAGTLYGRGIYLAESCSKSDEYSRENADGHRCILLCRATLGNILYNDEVSPNIDWILLWQIGLLMTFATLLFFAMCTFLCTMVCISPLNKHTHTLWKNLPGKVWTKFRHTFCTAGTVSKPQIHLIPLLVHLIPRLAAADQGQEIPFLAGWPREVP